MMEYLRRSPGARHLLNRKTAFVGLVVVIAAVLSGVAYGSFQPPVRSQVRTTFPAGWNLLGGPTGQTFPTDVPLYTYGANDQDYEVLPAGSAIQGGKGYWVYFSSPTSVSFTDAGSNGASVDTPGGQWIMVGNPSGNQEADVSGADVVYSYDPASGQYVAGNHLKVGAGAWAYLQNAGTITVRSSGSSGNGSSGSGSSGSGSPYQLNPSSSGR